MKLASRKGGRDGRLMLASRDLTRWTEARAVRTLQAALDGWADMLPQLEAEYGALCGGDVESTPFDATACEAPLPRAYQWADGSAYVNHVELVRRARGAGLPSFFWTDPLMYQGGSDAFLGPRELIRMADEAWGIDFEAEVAVIVDDTPGGIGLAAARDKIRLLMLVNDVSLRGLIPAELAKGFGFFQSKPSSAFSPVAVTPDELGPAWDGGKVDLPLLVQLNGVPFGRAEAGRDMTFDFPRLIAHAARTRALRAGTIIGSGTVSNKDADGGPGRPVSDGGLGYSCIAELRMIQTIQDGAPKTPFMRYGDTVRIEMLDSDGRSIFGAIEQTVVRDTEPHGDEASGGAAWTRRSAMLG